MIIHYSLPPNPRKRFESTSNEIIFGRHPRSGQRVDIDLEGDGYVSHVHARLICENNEYWIEDLHSENGTWVDGKKIQGRQRLAPGAKIRLGWTEIEVEMETPTPLQEPVQISETDDTMISELDATTVSPSPSPKAAPPSSVKDKISELEETVIKDMDSEAFPAVADDKLTTQPTPEPDLEPEADGTIVTVTDATTPPFTRSISGTADDTQKQAWFQLKALNDFIQALNTEITIENLGQILLEQLRQAIPSAQRGAVLLPDQQGELLLKAHWPPGEHSVSMTWVKRAYTRREAFIWTAKPAEESTEDNAPMSAIYYDVQSAIYLPLLSAGEVLGVMYVDNYFTREAFSQTDFELLRALANQVAMFLKDHVLRRDLQREGLLRSKLLRQYSPKVADCILKKSGSLQRGGEQVSPVTILISDVRNFTALSAKMEPDEVVRSLNEMFDAFVPIISEFDGIVDKYVGDSVLAVFGSPEHDPNQWEKAVKVALKMQQAMHMLGEGRKIRRLPVFTVGIGIHSGEVIHGFIGSIERTEFTVIGDTVNRAARYCDGAGQGEIIISKTVYERVYHKVNVQSKIITTKHPDVEPDLEAYVVKGLKGDEG